MSSTGERKTNEILGDLQEKGDLFTKSSVVERKRQADLEDAIQHIVSETEKYRAKAKSSAIDVMNLHILTPNPAYSRADGVNIAKEAQMVTAKSLNVMESTLNKLLQRRSEVIVIIKKLKTEIDHGRKMRISTDVTHKQYEDVLSITKSAVEKYLAESTAVVEERDRLLEKRDALERINVEEQKVFQEEYETMGIFIKEQNAALEDALLRERKADRQKKGQADTNAPPRQGDHTLEEELEMARKVGNLTDFVLSEQSSLQGIQQKINNYEMMFEQLKKMTQAASLDDVISTYIEQEEEMFSLYTFIQTVNSDIDTVTEATAQVAANIQKYKKDQQNQDVQRRTVLDEMQSKLQAQVALLQECEEVNKMHYESVSQISKKVSSVFFKLQCDQMDSKQSNASNSSSSTAKTAKASSSSRPESKIGILTSQGVSESNVLDYMGCIEQRSVDIIAEFIRHNKTMTNITSGTGKSFPAGPRSPTPGPTTPMQWPMQTGNGNSGAFDLDINAEEDLINADPSSGQDESDNKPVDLSLYMDKLKKRLNLGATNSSAGGFGNTNKVVEVSKSKNSRK
jgi:hypothetical protein